MLPADTRSPTTQSTIGSRAVGTQKARPGSFRSRSTSSFKPEIDEAHSVVHNLGFVPVVWIRNLPGLSSTGDPADGACTFRAAIETQIEIDYQLSQAGRGLKDSSDPTLLIKEPATTDSEIIKGAGNALVVSEKGDAKLLEIGGTASAAVIDMYGASRAGSGKRARQPGECRPANRSSVGPRPRTDEPRPRVARRQSSHQLRRRSSAALARMVLRASQVYRLRITGREIQANGSCSYASLAKLATLVSDHRR